VVDSGDQEVSRRQVRRDTHTFPAENGQSRHAEKTRSVEITGRRGKGPVVKAHAEKKS